MSCNVYEEISGLTLEGPDISWEKKERQEQEVAW